MATLLYIAPDDEGQRTWASSFRNQGHDTTVAHTMDTAVEQLLEGGFDLILLETDDRLGSMRQLVTAIDRLVDAPPLLLISDSPSAPEISARIGAAGFLAKPCENAEVVAVIERLVGPVRSPISFEDDTTGSYPIRT